MLLRDLEWVYHLTNNMWMAATVRTPRGELFIVRPTNKNLIYKDQYRFGYGCAAQCDHWTDGEFEAQAVLDHYLQQVTP